MTSFRRYSTIASIPAANPFGWPAACVWRLCARAAPTSKSVEISAARRRKTTCLVGEKFTSSGPMCPTEFQSGPHSPFGMCLPMHTSFAKCELNHGISSAYESVMCGVMMSTFSGGAGAACSCAEPTAGASTFAATATASPANRERAPTASLEKRKAERPDDLMSSALEEQRFEQGRHEEERDETDQRGRRRKPEGFHDHQRVHGEHHKPDHGANPPPRDHVGLGG